MRAWANADQQVAYRRRDSSTAITPNIINVAVDSGIYGTGELAESREEFFQQLEEEWEGLRQELLTSGDLTGQRRSLLSVYTAIQLSRTLKHVDQTSFACNVAALTEERPIPKSAVRQYLAELDDGSEPDEAEVDAAWTFVVGSPGIPTPDEVLKVAMHVAVDKSAPALEAMHWRVETFGKPALMTSDCPVTAWRRTNPGEPERGVGIGNADEVRFPLSPTALLVLTPTPVPASPQSPDRRFVEVNRETCRQCHQFVVATVQYKARLDNLQLAPRGPRLRFRSGPLYRRNAYGIDEPMGGDVIHMYTM